MGDESTRRHVVASLVIEWLIGTMTYRANPRTRTQYWSMDNVSDTSPQTVSRHFDARSSEEVGSMSTPRAMMSAPTHVALKARSHSDRS